MLLKSRTESNELLAYRYLNTRMELTETEKFHYLNLEKGYKGEVKFDQLTETLREERYIINDLLLEVNNSYFQIDSLIISQGVIHLIDIKNYYGDFYLKSDKLYTVKTNREYKNPIDQLKRSTTLFNQLLQKLKQNYLIESFIIFINPEFTLYQVPIDQPIIFPTQINRFIDEFNQTPSQLNNGHKNLAYELLSLHKPKNPFTIFPQYHYDHLQKGAYCKNCRSLLNAVRKTFFVCGKCGEQEKIELTILRSIEEFRLLFPDRKLATQNIYEWCNLDLHKKTFCRILKKNYTTYGNTNNTYYK
jgi:hypothetical protein